MYRVGQANTAYPPTVEWNYRIQQGYASTSLLHTQAWPTACIYLWREREGENMALSREGLIQELKHQIHSPLAAIRNALYLTAVRIDDPEALRYLALAEAEISRIAAVLKNADQIQENKQVHVLIRSMGKASAA
jgi:nitrogen-specific signal transduction histidine kinase